MFTKLRNMIRIMYTTRNFYSPILVYMGITKKCVVELIDGSAIEVSKETWPNYWSKIIMLYLQKKLSFRAVDKFLLEITFKGNKLTFRVPEIPTKFNEFKMRVLEMFYLEPY